jgi:tRNA 2-thiouridine synthesizing protein E
MYRPMNRKISYFDDAGFLLNPCRWNRGVALSIAREEGMDHLKHKQWVMLAALRRYYFKYHSPPAMHYICHVTHLGEHCTSRLFARGAREAWRIAGLPNPGEEARAYM